MFSCESNRMSKNSVCLEGMMNFLARLPNLMEISATWSVLREHFLLTTLSLTHTHTKSGHPHGSALLSPCQGQVGDTRWHQVAQKGGNRTPECPDPCHLGCLLLIYPPCHLIRWAFAACVCASAFWEKAEYFWYFFAYREWVHWWNEGVNETVLWWMQLFKKRKKEIFCLHIHIICTNSPGVRGDYDDSRYPCIHPARPQLLSRCLPTLCSVSKVPFSGRRDPRGSTGGPPGCPHTAKSKTHQ